MTTRLSSLPLAVKPSADPYVAKAGAPHGLVGIDIKQLHNDRFRQRRPVARRAERVKFVPFRQNGEGVRPLEAGVGAACKNHPWQKQPRRVFSLRVGTD